MKNKNFHSNLDLLNKLSENIDIVVEYQGIARRLSIRNNQCCFSLEDKLDYAAFNSLEDCLKNTYWDNKRLLDLVDDFDLISLQAKA